MASSSEIASVIVIQSYRDGLSGVCTANAATHLSLGRDPEISNQPVLSVAYPAPTKDPAGRPDARTGGRIDVTDVKWIAFTPQDVSSGRLAIGKIVVTR